MRLLGKTDVMKRFLGKLRAIWIKNKALRENCPEGIEDQYSEWTEDQYSPKTPFLTQKSLQKINFSISYPFSTQTLLFYPTIPS